ncbi:MAG: hypothetical protein ABSD73_11010 [Candidatus Bathyarchaeia archaeon]|jgi:hypothetical protein
MKKAITGIMLAIMAMSVFSFVPNFANADFQSQGTWVRMNGYITQWNTTDGNSTRTFGWIIANAAIVNKNGTTHEWATAYATWSDILRAYPMGEHALGDVNVSDMIMGNFSYTFSFYTARLLNVSDLSFNKTETGHDFYLAGIWNVTQRTETINITWSDPTTNVPWGDHMRQITITWTDTPVAINANGILVADWGSPYGWVGKFVLSIDGVGTLSGFAWKSIIWTRELNICDLSERGKVDINDLVKVAKHYGEAPGFGNYDPSLDVNGEGQIGIGDLTTIAANIQG